jgi:hypothetical protein
VWREDEWQREDSETRATVYYNGSQISWGEFFELARPDFVRRVKLVRDLKGTCRISLAPTALAVASLAVGFLYPLVNAGHLTDDEKKTFYIVGGVGGAVFTALSYPLGGYACRRAEKQTRGFELAMKHNLDNYTDEVYAEFQKLADEFNARVGAAPETPNGASEETPPAEEEVAP